MKTVKMIFAAFAMAAFTLSCTREAEISDSISVNRQTVITASFEGASRTALQNGSTQIYWEPADEIKVFFKTFSGRFVSQNSELAEVADFMGTLTALVGANEGAFSSDMFWGLYPFRSDAVYDGNSVTTILPAAQTGRAGGFERNTHITLACSIGANLAFYHVCGGVRFSLTQEGIKKVTLEGNNEEALAGTIKMAFVDGLPAIQELTEPQTKITLTAPGDGTFQTGVWYYIEAVPGTLSGGYKMTFYKEDESAEFCSESSVTIKRGAFGSRADADEGLIFKPTGGDDPDPEDIISFADPIAKYACVDKFDTNGDGEVSYAEAAAATTLSGLFTDWSTVTSFEEIKYFTGVSSTANVFNGLAQLDSITIPAQITTLGTFGNCTALKKVVLPEELTAIPNNCFRNCSALETIVLPSKVTSIGSYAFSGCSALQRVVLANGIKTLPNDCFSGCGALSEVELPAALTAISNNCFRNCTALASLTIPASVTSIGNNAFQGCSSLNGLLLPENLNNIGTYAFQNCTSIEMIALPDGMTALSTGLFSGCKALTTISWPTNLQSIGDLAFNGCSFENNDYSLELPISITTIGANAFTCIFHLIIPTTANVSISSNAFGNPASSYTNLYVPSSKVEIYKVRTNWSAYADRIHSIEEYPVGIDIFVDLGLSVKWAFINVGASYPWEFGDYFAWGETEPKEDYSWSTYKWCMGSNNTLTKYCNVSRYGYNGFADKKTVLDPEDDAATANWGDSWRMPTLSECQELLDNCTKTWTTLNGVYGSKFTSNKEGYTGKWIFLPAAGYRQDTNPSYPGFNSSHGLYWSSSLNTNYPYYANDVGFESGQMGWRSVDRYNRYLGQSIRPVCE